MDDSELIKFLERERKNHITQLNLLTVENTQLKQDRDNLQNIVIDLNSRLAKAEADLLLKADK